MSNQIETQIDVSLTERNRVTALFRIILAVPVLIFVSSFSPSAAFSDEAVGIFAGLLALPAGLAIVFRQVYPSYVLVFNEALLSLQTRVDAYLVLLTDEYPSIEENDSGKFLTDRVAAGFVLKPEWLLCIFLRDNRAAPF